MTKLRCTNVAAALLVLAFALAHGANVCPPSISQALCDQRYQAAQAFALRAMSIQNMQIAYGQYVTPSITHAVQDVGEFPGIVIASEYDMLTVGLAPLLGYSPIALRSNWDASTTRWLTDDVLRIDYFLNASTLFNFTTGRYDINVDGMRYTDFFTFAPNDYHLTYDYGIQDAVGKLIFATNSATFTPAALCAGVIVPACNRTDPGCNGNCWPLTQYSSVADCIAFITQLDQGPPNPCPYPERSNTKVCRLLHGLSSFFIPSIHCAHVPAVSPVCTDSCLDGPCAHPAPNSHCAAIWPGLPTDYTLVYAPVCNDGYTGDGVTSCVANTCAKDSDCPSNVAVCSNATGTGLCQCPPTFVWDTSVRAQQTHRTCVCPDGTREFPTGPNGQRTCIRVGQCLGDNVEQCPQTQLGQRNAIKCRPYGVNPYSPFNQCLCNYGYSGGVEYPCTCDAPRTEVYSPAVGGTVCLAPGECVRDAQCTAGQQHCVIPAGANIGQCA